MKIIDDITCRLMLIFPEISGKYTTLTMTRTGLYVPLCATRLEKITRETTWHLTGLRVSLQFRRISDHSISVPCRIGRWSASWHPWRYSCALSSADDGWWSWCLVTVVNVCVVSPLDFFYNRCLVELLLLTVIVKIITDIADKIQFIEWSLPAANCLNQRDAL